MRGSNSGPFDPKLNTQSPLGLGSIKTYTHSFRLEQNKKEKNQKELIDKYLSYTDQWFQ